MQNIGMDFAGGANMQGLQESSQESGRAILARQSMGMIMTSNFLVSLARFEENMARYMLKKMTRIYDYEFKIKILGKTQTAKYLQSLKENKIYEESSMKPGVGWLTVNAEGTKPLIESEYSIKTQPVSAREFDKETKLNQLITFLTMAKIPVTDELIPIVGELMGLEQTEIETVKGVVAKQIAQQQQAMQMQQEMMKQKMAQGQDQHQFQQAEAIHKGVIKQAETENKILGK